MALINCAECKGNVSTLAAACPHCGAPVLPSVAATPADEPKIPWPPILPPQPQIEAKPGPSSPQPNPAEHLPSLDGIFRLRMLGIALILSGIGYIGYFFFRSQMDPVGGIFPPKPKPDGPPFGVIPIYILFLVGGWALKDARSRQQYVENRLQKKP
jgi:hypothetical protein